MTEIYLMQHGNAFPDGDSPLSEEGKNKVEASGTALKNLGIQFDLILSSTKKRSQETAKIIKKETFHQKEILESELIKPKTPAEDTLSFLQNHIDQARILIVGHLPSLAEIASHLLSPTHINIQIQNGGCTRIDTNSLMDHTGTLIWHLTPEQLKGLS